MIVVASGKHCSLKQAFPWLIVAVWIWQQTAEVQREILIFKLKLQTEATSGQSCAICESARPFQKINSLSRREAKGHVIKISCAIN